MWPYKQKRSTLDFVMRLEIFIQGKRSLKYVAAKRKQISISGGGDIWRGPGTANSKLTASCHQRPGPNSLPAFYFYSSSSTEFNACALRTLLSIGLALDFHRARGKMYRCSLSSHPPLPSLSRELWSASREEIFAAYWISIRRDQNVLMRSRLRSTNKQGCCLLWKNSLSEKEVLVMI